MTPGTTDKSRSKEATQKRKDRAAEIANTFEWLITAFMLAFVFRAFVMEAFRIPTGSMADTLKGAHFQLACPQCGYQYAHNFGGEQAPNYDVPIESSPRCPSCGYVLPARTRMPPANGDRILVLKCIYQFFEPKRWDVVVFKNPDKPWENFIKRLVARPEETVEIIDGDVYIDGEIARKPPKIQEELWMPVYDNDYQPVRPELGRFNDHQWRQPFRNMAGSKWNFDAADPTVFELESDVDVDDIHVMFYDATLGNNFGAENCAYNPSREYKWPPYCSDLMVRFYANLSESEGVVGIGLSKYGRRYKAQVDAAGIMTIAQSDNGTEWTELTDAKIERPVLNKPVLVRFVNVDHQLLFQFGDETLTHDLGLKPEAAGSVNGNVEPEVRIFGSGRQELSHIAIFRDTYYTLPQQQGGGFASAGRPFKLEPGEFFVLGDNSPASHDSRRWSNMGVGINGEPAYRAGTVPHDYLVGKAIFVYWPSGYEFPWPRSLKARLKSSWQNRSRLSAIIYWAVTLRWIPNISQMRFIYGGSNNND